MADEAAVPPEIQAAVDAGNVEETTKLLAAAPESMSKALKKKLLKNAEIAAKKAAKGGATAPAAPAAGKPAAAGAAAATSPAPAGKKAVAAAAKPPPAPSSDLGVAGAKELELVAAMLSCAEHLNLPDGALANLQENSTALALALSPHVAAMRNQAYSAGFTAHGSRAAEGA